MPLRWKIVGLYALVLAGVISGFSALLVVRLRQALEQGVWAELEARARTIGAIAELENGKWIIEPKSGIDEEFAASREHWYVVRDAAGAVALASPLARTLGFPIGQDGETPHRRADVRSLEVVRKVTKSENEDEPAMRNAPLTVSCGKVLEKEDRAVAALVEQLAIFGPLVLLVGLAGGLWVAGRALRPIGAIARTAEEIGTDDLSRRIPVRGRDELARLAATINAMLTRLQAAFEREKRFVADASHELRTPLSIVAGNVELALSRPRSEDELRSLLADAQDATRSMQELVDGLLVLARAGRRDGAEAGEPVSLLELCEDVVRRCQPLAERSRVTIRVEAEGEAVVRGNRAALAQLVTNLVTNAVRYNRDGGTVTVRIRREATGARLEVEDTGIGIPERHLPRVFDRFFRVDEARARDAGGVGLGLAIAKCVAEAHGGTISVTSQEGVGTRFVVLVSDPNPPPSAVGLGLTPNHRPSDRAL